MAEITLSEVKQLARLSRIALSGQESKAIKKDLGSILAYIDRLQRAALEGVKPVSHISGIVNEGRADEEKETLASSEKMIGAFLKKKGRHACVPRILHHD